MISLNELTKKEAMGVGTAATLAGAGGAAAGGAYRKGKDEAAERAEILSRKGGVTSAQRETFADKQELKKDALSPSARKFKDVTTAADRRMDDFTDKAKEAGSAISRGLKRAYNFYTKPGEAGHEAIQKQMELVHKSWSKGGDAREAVAAGLKRLKDKAAAIASGGN